MADCRHRRTAASGRVGSGLAHPVIVPLPSRPPSSPDLSGFGLRHSGRPLLAAAGSGPAGACTSQSAKESLQLRVRHSPNCGASRKRPGSFWQRVRN